VANRRRFDEVMEVEWRRAIRNKQPLSLLLVDVDHFKLYNDTFGHLRGDSCLQQIAESSTDVVVRPGDLVARYGGEEFGVILPNTDEHGARTIAEKICESLRNRRIHHPGNISVNNPSGIVTVSVGCCTLVPTPRQLPSRIIDLADRALYQAKHDGRNQVACAAVPKTINIDDGQTRAHEMKRRPSGTTEE
jgi:two-component system chemotaxis family response regulator WspR